MLRVSFIAIHTSTADRRLYRPGGDESG